LRGRLLPLVDLREQLELPAVARETTYVVVLQAENQEYGVIVDDILDTEEIVVKPLGAQLRSIALFAGATIMGDGSVALILDATAIARRAGMSLESAVAGVEEVAAESDDLTSVLVVDLGDGRRAAIPLEAVDRLEEIDSSLVEHAGPHEVVQYRGEILPLVRLAHVLQAGDAGLEADHLQVVVCRGAEGLVGIVVAGIFDIVEADLAVRTPLDSTGASGSALIDGHVTELVDLESTVAGVTGSRLAWTA
jgi:two-component system chemotaxis sensor kinase CheA